MDRIEPSGDLSAEFAFLRGMLTTSGGWARSALAAAACESPWFSAQVAELAPPPAANPALALAAGVVVSLPVFGPLAASAGEWGDVMMRQVLGHTSVDGEVFDFRDGEAVWSDTGKAVSRTQIRALDPGTRQEFYASMGLATPASPNPEITTLTASPAQPAAERIRVYRDGREAPVLAAVRERVAVLRAQKRAEYLALVGPAQPRTETAPAPASLAGEASLAATSPAALAASPGSDAKATGTVKEFRPATLFDQVWAQVARERAAAKAQGETPPAALAQVPGKPPSLFQQIWAEVQAERAAARGDGVVGTMAAGPLPAGAAAAAPLPAEQAWPDMADAPRQSEMADAPATPDLAGDAPSADIADVPPDRDLIDASAAFIEPRG